MGSGSGVGVGAGRMIGGGVGSGGCGTQAATERQAMMMNGRVMVKVGSCSLLVSLRYNAR